MRERRAVLDCTGSNVNRGVGFRAFGPCEVSSEKVAGLMLIVQVQHTGAVSDIRRM